MSNFTIKELEAKSIFSQRDGIVLDFRPNDQCFFIDKSGKILKPNETYKITIEKITK